VARRRHDETAVRQGAVAGCRDGGVDAEAEYVVAAIVTAVAYIGSLLAHELAHSLVARPLNAGNRLG